ncbi:MAG: FG-GAP-like repeat-containing protein [Actinobacteria bacterium]|nr:FG-GAP-like repeat-containing protein [Actinomycetota bacterium]
MRLRRLTPVLAGVLLTPLFVILPVDISSAKPTPKPVQGAASETVMVDVSRPEAASAAPLSSGEIADVRREVAEDTQGTKTLPDAGVEVLRATAPQAISSKLSAVAVTWAKGTGGKAAAQLRTKKDGNWGAWENLEVDPSVGPDAGKNAKGTPARQGSELYMVTGATEVQGRVIGAAGHQPIDPKLTVIDPGSSDADATVGAAQAGAAHAVTARPNIYTRAQWGADESWRTGTPESNTPRGIVIHHTADSNNYGPADVPGMLRAMYRYATKTLGWDDIAYNFIIDRYGRIWQGRAWLYPEQPVWPAATLSNNDRTIGVSMLGNYDSERLSSAARGSLTQLMAWETSLRGINPQGTMQLYNNKSDRYETMSTITGHRDTYYTACPGGTLYPLIPGLRTEVTSLMGSVSGPAISQIFRDFDGMGDTDILARDASGQLMLSSPNGSGNMTEPERIGGTGWQQFDVVTVAGDWNGDGTPDILARNRWNGDLWLYPGNGNGGFKAASKIGNGWGDMQTIVAPGDWNGDGLPDIIATNRTNWNMYFYSGNGKGGFARAGIQIGNGWGSIKSFAGVGSWDGNGRPSLVAVTFDGVGVVYTGTGKGGFYNQVNQPGDWSRFSVLTGVSNAYGDRKSGVLGVAADGTASFGTRASNGTVAWKQVAQSFAGLTVFGG